MPQAQTYVCPRPKPRARVAGPATVTALGMLTAHRGRSIAVTLRADRTTSARRALAASVSARCGTARAKELVRAAQAVENQVRPPVTE